MQTSSHINSLKTKHDALKAQIHTGHIHHASDEELLRMKKAKLHLKDEIHRLRLQMKQERKSAA